MSPSYRYPNEQVILALTIFLVLGVIVFTSAATFCLSGIFIIGMLVVSYFMTRSQHHALMVRAQQVTPQTEPDLSHLVEECVQRLQPGPIQVFVAPVNALNAYTFGLVSPQVVVVYAGVFRLMDADELRFIIGHELGHVRLGHTWLNSLIGGMAGIPSPFLAAVLLYFSFRWWNRACEYSADRAGLLACGKPEKAASALVKLVGGPAAVSSQQAWQQTLRRIDAEDDRLDSNLSEMLSTHPMIIKRLQALRSYSASPEYQRLQAQVNGLHPL
jgi:Zn-dependent protease with chaperone function